MLNAKNTMQVTKSIASTIRVMQPAGTNHFQFRCHQLRRGGCEGSGGGWGVAGKFVSIGLFCPVPKPKSSNFGRLNFICEVPRKLKSTPNTSFPVTSKLE